jgi:hypothetical protein
MKLLADEGVRRLESAADETAGLWLAAMPLTSNFHFNDEAYVIFAVHAGSVPCCNSRQALGMGVQEGAQHWSGYEVQVLFDCTFGVPLSLWTLSKLGARA